MAFRILGGEASGVRLGCADGLLGLAAAVSLIANGCSSGRSHDALDQAIRATSGDAGAGSAESDATGTGANSTVGSAPGVACDPLATHPTTLATIIGAAKDPGGTLYVADRGGIVAVPSIVRVFVIIGGTAVRQHVIGFGQIGASEYIGTFESADGSTDPRDLDIQVDSSGKAISMTLGAAGSGKARIDRLDAGVPTSLALVDPSSVQGTPAVDLPGTVDYVADASDGEAIAVTSPLENDEGSADFRLFYGFAAAMQERPIVSFDQALSGYPSIGFSVGSQTFVMAISSLPPADGGVLNQPGPVTLTGGGRTVQLTLRLPTPTDLSGFHFECLRP
jgi:hypothetical protein